MAPIFRTIRTALPALLILAGFAAAQPPIDLPRLSPRATVSQEFGYAKATVIYSRPAVAGRPVWGGVVPYGRVWRAGANEPTVIEFTRDVGINGNPLAAGSYGLFILPEKQGKQDSWTFIFSRNTKGWGAYGYDAKDDALRVTVKTEKGAHQERMEFAFDDISDAGATLSLRWASLRGALALTSEFLETGKANIAKGMPGIKPDDPYGWLGAARFYWVHNIDRKQAMEWVDKSIAVKPLFNNLWAKAEWLAEDKRYAEALESGRKAREEAAKDPGTASQIPAMDKIMKAWKGK